MNPKNLSIIRNSNTSVFILSQSSSWPPPTAGDPKLSILSLCLFTQPLLIPINVRCPLILTENRIPIPYKEATFKLWANSFVCPKHSKDKDLVLLRLVPFFCSRTWMTLNSVRVNRSKIKEKVKCQYEPTEGKFRRASLSWGEEIKKKKKKKFTMTEPNDSLIWIFLKWPNPLNKNQVSYILM